MFHVVNPSLTAPGNASAERFIAAVGDCLRRCRVTVDWLDDWQALRETTVRDGDAIVHVNPPQGGAHSSDLLGWLAAVSSTAIVFTIALDGASEAPPEPASHLNAYLLHQARRRLGDRDAHEPIAATEFVYEALAQVRPTLNRERLRLFLSYRRSDGAPLAECLKRQLRERGKSSVFLDLDDVPVGRDFAEVIDGRLLESDVLLLLDTPDVAESPYVEHEVTAALVSNIPIVWIRVGPAPAGGTRRRPLPVPPADVPTLALDTLTPDAVTPEFVDAVVGAACRLTDEHARRAMAMLRELERVAEARGGAATLVDLRRLIVELREPERAVPFPRRPRTDIVQLFGRHPDHEDRRALVDWLESRRMGPHEAKCRAFDAAVLLDPMPVCVSAGADDHVVVAGASVYSTSLGREPGAGPDDHREAGRLGDASGPRLLLFSAFPQDGEVQGRTVAAVNAVVGQWVALGGSVTFGGHPTITGLVLELVRRVAGDRTTPVVRVYQSEYFGPLSPALARADARTEVVRTSATEDRRESLTVMRRQMVDESAAVAAVVIGGRTHEGGQHQPGVDEELALARAAGIPVFLLGGAGGRAAELAAEFAQARWAGLGNSLGEDNERLYRHDDYEALARLVWDSTAR